MPARIAPRGLVLLLALALGFATARAAELDFSASVDRTTVGPGEQFQLNLTVRGEDMISVPTPVLPPLPDFNLLGSSSSQSTSISIVNGRMQKQASVTFVYGLSAKRLGKLVIPPCKLTYQGREYQSQAVEITAVKAAQGQAAPAPAARPGIPPTRAGVPVEGNLLLSVVPSRRTLYVGEPVTVEVSLCTRLQITNGGWAEMPAFEGFWAEKGFDADKFDFARRVIDGKEYGVSLLKKVTLFPLSPGEARIKPMAFNVVVARPPRDVFDFFGTSQSLRIESKPVTLSVLALPETGRPQEFTGGVGQFTMSAALDAASAGNGEPVNLTVRVAGSGNTRLIVKPAIPSIPGLKILDPEIKDDLRLAGTTMRGTRTFRFPIIAQTDGKYVIPPIRVAYFDPQAKAYKTLQAGPFEFSASGSAPNAPLVEATGLKVLGTDISYIKPDARALAVTPFAAPRWPGLLYVLSLGTLGGAFWYRRHSSRLTSDRGYARKLRSSGLVKRRLRQAERLLKKNDEKGFHAELAQAVMGYVGDRFNIETQAMTQDQLRAEMERLQVGTETAAAVLEVITECDIARFSPGMLAQRDPQRLLQKARDALGRV